MRRLFLLCVILLATLPVYAQDNPGYAEAERRIEAALANNAIELDLSDLDLDELPADIVRLTHLQVLRLYGNRLSALPESIGQLTGLQTLHVSSNQLTSIPESIGQLTSLKFLIITGTQLTTLPDSIGELKNLQGLYLEWNNLTELPDSFTQLTQLETLFLAHNQLTKLPDDFGQLTGLQELNLIGNQLRELPLSMGNLKLKALPLYYNPLVFPPPKIVEKGGVAILTYLRDYEQIRAQQVVAMGAVGVGVVAGFGLLWRWKTRRGKSKRKNG